MAGGRLGKWKEGGLDVQMELIGVFGPGRLSREKAFKGLWWGDPTSTLQDPDGMMWRLIGPGGIGDYWRDPEFDRLGNDARFNMDPKQRADDYVKMHPIFLANLPWIPVIQP